MIDASDKNRFDQVKCEIEKIANNEQIQVSLVFILLVCREQSGS